MNNRLTNTNCDTRNQAFYFSGRTVIFYHKLCTSLQFFDFLYGGRRHLGFSKFQIFNGRKVQEGPTASLCQISSKSLKTRPRYVSWNIMLVWLENAYSRPFWGVFKARFPQMMSKWNFQGLRFYRGSNWFWMGLTTVQRYCAACDCF